MGLTITHPVEANAVWQRCDQYADEFGFNAAIYPGLEAIVTNAGLDSGLRVVTVPKPLGRLVRSRLLHLDIHAPVISQAQQGSDCGECRTWQFLGVASPEDTFLHREFVNDPVFLLHKVSTFLDSPILLPYPGSSRCTWIDPPVRGEIPSFLDLVDGIRHVFAEMGRP